MLARIIWNPYGAIVVGLLALAAGGAALAGVNLACSGTTTALQAGQSCDSRTGDVLTFTQWQSEQRLVTIVLLALGAVLLLGGAAFLARRKRRQPSAPASAA